MLKFGCRSNLGIPKEALNFFAKNYKNCTVSVCIPGCLFIFACNHIHFCWLAVINRTQKIERLRVSSESSSASKKVVLLNANTHINPSAKSAMKATSLYLLRTKNPHIIRVGQLRIIVCWKPSECNFRENEMCTIKMAPVNGYEINLGPQRPVTATILIFHLNAHSVIMRETRLYATVYCAR